MTSARGPDDTPADESRESGRSDSRWAEVDRAEARVAAALAERVARAVAQTVAAAEREAAKQAAQKARREAEDAAWLEARTKEREALVRAQVEQAAREAPLIAEAQAREAALIAEAHEFEDRYGPASTIIGLQQTHEAFECIECGRWADVRSSAEVYSRLVEMRLGLGPADWGRVKSAAIPATPLRPALLQREFSKTYDEAVKIIDTAVGLGLLDPVKKGVVAAQPRCEACFERRAATFEPGQPVPRSRDTIPPQLRFRVLQRDGFRCQYCGRSARDGATLHLDHVVPASAGGETTEDNLITACETCNLGKSAATVI